MTLYTHILAFLVSFVAIGLKGFQQKNVSGHHYQLVVFTSYIMTVTDIAFVGLVVKYSWALFVSSGTGAACGMITAMILHNRFVGKKDA